MSQDEPVEKTQKAPGIARTAGLVGSLTLVSKVLGMARDVVVLQTFGTSLVSDAWNYAFLFSGNVLVLFGGLGGPFHAATMTVVRKRTTEPVEGEKVDYEEKPEDEGKLVAQIFVCTLLITLMVTAVFWIFAPELIRLVAPANGKPIEYRELLWAEATKQLKIMLPLVSISGMLGVACGVANAHFKVFGSSLSPIMQSISIIVALYVFQSQHIPIEQGGVYLAVGTLVGALLQFLIQGPEIAQLKLQWGLPLKPVPGLSTYMRMVGPAALGTQIGQLNVFIDSWFTSAISEGAWTAYVNANRLVQLPLGVLLTSLLIPIANHFADQVKGGQIEEMKHSFRRGLRGLWFLALPISAILMAIPGPIVQLLFERGRFDPNSREMFIAVLMFLVPQVFFYLPRDLITRMYYAQDDSRTPFLVGLSSLIFVKPVANYLLVGPLGLGGIALSTTLVTIFNMSALWLLMIRKIGHLGTFSLMKPIMIMMFASGACAATSYYSDLGLASLMPHNLTGLTKFFSLGVEVAMASAAGCLVYLAICFIFKLEETQMVMKLLNRLARIKS